MELVETINAINQRLKDHYGIDTESTDPLYRIVFSDDMLEKRLTNYTKEGFELITPIVVEVPKYKQWIHQKYVLEQLVGIPLNQRVELADLKVSYEPLWVFQNKNGNYLPPKWEAAQYVIELMRAAKGSSNNFAKYKPKEEEINDFEGQKLRQQKIMEELFGNETDTGDALAHNEAIVVPRNFERSE